MTNYFATFCCPQSTLPVLPADVDCVPLPSLSQLAGVILMPLGAPLPDDWTDYYSWTQVLDNLDLSGLKSRYFIVTGEITEAQDITQRLGRSKNLIVRRKYTATIYPQWFDDNGYEFLRSIQKSKLSFRFWLATYGGRLLGGAKGIRPDFVTAKMIYAGDTSSFEQAKLVLEWYADVEPDRTNLPQLFNTLTPMPFMTLWLSQSYPNYQTNILVWTEQFSYLPTTNQSASIQVFQNGQRLSNTQYIVDFNTITVDADVHFNGSNYQILAYYGGMQVFIQDYTDNQDGELLWLQTSQLPTSNQEANIWVYQNGQKMMPFQYTVNANSISININSHYPGANYTVFTIFP